jgi:hypothetical protein
MAGQGGCQAPIHFSRVDPNASTTVIALAALAAWLAPEALPFIIASGVLSIASIAAGAAGNPELAEALGWAALGVAVAGTIYEIASMPDPPAAGGSASDKLGESASPTGTPNSSPGDQSPPGRTPSKDEVLTLRGEGAKGALPRHEKIAADKIGILGGDNPKLWRGDLYRGSRVNLFRVKLCV